MKKKTLSLALALVIALTLLPTAAFATDSNFTIENGVLKEYTGPGGAVTIPNGVTSIGGWAFYGCTDLTSVTIPDSVTSIGFDAFRECTHLTSVTIPNSVTSIRQCAFFECRSLPSVIIPDSVTDIGAHVFAYCTGLTSVTISNSVTSIVNNSFRDCTGLTSVTVPNSITSIGWGAFAGCTGMTSVIIPNSVTSIGSSAFQDCTGLKDAYYGGTEAQWKAINIEYNNAPLTNATIHYNSTMPNQSTDSEQPTQPIQPQQPTHPNEMTQQFVDIAMAQRGKTSNDLDLGSDWCGKFVSWCAKQKGLENIINPSGTNGVNQYNYIIDHGGTGVRFYDNRGDMKAGTYLKDRNQFTPQAGDIVVFTWDHYDSKAQKRLGPYGDTIQHVGIVHSVENGEVKVVHGNWYVGGKGIVVGPGDESKCTVSWDITSPEIFAYARPNWASIAPSQPQGPAQTAMPTNDKLTRDGEAQDPTVYKIGDSNYFKIRDLAAILNGTDKQFSVGYDSEKQSVTVTTGEAYTMTDTELKGAASSNEAAEVSNDAIYVNGKKVEAEVYKIGGNNYFKLRDLGKALDFYVGWSADKGMYIDSGRSYDADQ